MSALVVYIAVMVTVVAVSLHRAIGGLTVLTKPRLSVSNAFHASVDGIECEPRDVGVCASCVTLVSPLPLQLVGISYTVQVGEHDAQYGGVDRAQAVAILRDWGFDERAFLLPDLGLGAYFHPGQDVWLAALAMPVARELHRLDVVLAMVDAGGRTVRFTANALSRRLPQPVDLTGRSTTPAPAPPEGGSILRPGESVGITEPSVRTSPRREVS